MNAKESRNIINTIISAEAELHNNNQVRDNLINDDGDTLNILILNGLTLISLVWDNVEIVYMATLEELATILSGMNVYQNTF